MYTYIFLFINIETSAWDQLHNSNRIIDLDCLIINWLKFYLSVQDNDSKMKKSEKLFARVLEKNNYIYDN